MPRSQRLGYRCEEIPDFIREGFEGVVKRLFRASKSGTAEGRISFNCLEQAFLAETYLGDFALYLPWVIWQLMCERLGYQSDYFCVSCSMYFIEWKLRPPEKIIKRGA